MPQRARDILGTVGKLLVSVTFFLGVVKYTVMSRIEASEQRIANLEHGQVEQDVRFTECMHRIDMHLFSLDMNVSNALEILKAHQLKISALPNLSYGNQAQGNPATH